MIFDSHAHLNDEAFAEDRARLIASLSSVSCVINEAPHVAGDVRHMEAELHNGETGAGQLTSLASVGYVCEIGYDRASSERALQLAEQYQGEQGAPQIYAAVGIHPEEAGRAVDADMDALRSMAAHKKAVAIGEIGLDYYWPEPDHETQKLWFRRQILLAKELKLPIAIHSREAAKDTYDMVKELEAAENGGILHCFSYAKEMAQLFVDMGMHIGIGGVLTFKNARKLREAAEWIPLSRIVLETDCPYMAPEPYRGKRNDPSRLIHVAEKLAELKGVSVEEVIRVTTQNAMEVYRISG